MDLIDIKKESDGGGQTEAEGSFFGLIGKN